MAKGKFERTKPHVNVGTIGHVDHKREVKLWQLLRQLKLGEQNLYVDWELKTEKSLTE